MGVESASTYGRASELCSILRLTAAGNIKATAGKLYWLIVTNEDNDTRYVILHDDNDATSDEVARFYVPTDTTKVFTFDPPIPCETGIRIGTFSESAMIVTGGYV